jgi:ABC-type transporter Mla subunit MlaD
MRGRGPIQSLAASPTMVGAVTTLIVIVAVFLAYNASRGLPFVPVYRVSVEVPNSARLVDFNEVRIGGARVGIIESIEPVLDRDDATTAAADEDAAGDAATDTDGVIARVNLKLDKSAEPLPRDSVFRVRYRSSFGLKYLEVVRGVGDPAPEGFTFDGTDDAGECQLPVDLDSFADEIPDSARDGCFQPQTEFDDINNTFDTPTRTNARRNLVGYGSAFAGRGGSLNDTIQFLRPLFANLRPVARTLIESDTRFRRFFPALAKSARIVAPVAEEQAQMFTNMAIAFAAISEDPEALRETISEGPPTLETGIRLLPRQRPFMRDLATFSREMRPGVRDLRVTLPVLNDALRVGTRVLPRTVAMNRDLRRSFRQLLRLVEQPTTRVTLQRLGELFREAEPLARWVVPVQTVCNYWNYWFTFTPNAWDRDVEGFSFRQIIAGMPGGDLRLTYPPEQQPIIDALDPTGAIQDNGTIRAPGAARAPIAGYSGVQSDGRAGAADPDGPGVFKPYELPIRYATPYLSTGQDGHDCQGGQQGYELGRLPIAGQRRGNPAIGVSDLPGSRGPTTLFWTQDSRRLEVDSRVPSRQPRTWRGIR